MMNTKSTDYKKHDKNKYSDIGKILYEFSTPEFVKQKRGQLWFIILGICVISGVIVGIFTDALSVVLLSIMIGFIYTITHNQEPQDIYTAFTDIGMQYKDKFYPYQNIEKFWIFYVPHQQKTLHIFIKNGRLRQEIAIHIKSQKINKIRETLGYYIPEDEDAKEPMQNMLARKLKL